MTHAGGLFDKNLNVSFISLIPKIPGAKLPQRLPAY
jgi:hypothetical protein